MPVSELWRRALRPAVFEAARVADAELLKRFCHARDAAAFELLVYRHGSMVWAVCRRIVCGHHSAEDAFQATFLSLARHAKRIRGSVPGWLHRVAVRAALDVMRRVRPHEQVDASAEPVDRIPSPQDAAANIEVSRRIDAAINRLPERLRRAVVLCELQGFSLKEAAANLNCPVGTVESRLTRARKKLRRMLAGLHATAVLSVPVVPSSLRAATVHAAIDRSMVTPAIASLAKRAAVGAGWGPALPAGMATILAAALLVAAFGLGQSEPPKPVEKSPPVAEKSDSAPKPRLDAEGVSLPHGAISRLGSSRFRHGGWFNGTVAFSSDGKQLATGGNGGVSVFETSTGRLLHHLPLTDKQMLRFVRFVADGKQLAVGSSDWNRSAELTVFNLADGKPLTTSKFSGRSQIFPIDVMRDGSRVLVEDRFEKVYLWDVKANKEIWSFKHPEAAFTMPFNADGKYFAEMMSRKAELRDATTGDVIKEFPKLDARFRSVYNASAISPNGKLATATENGDAVAVLEAIGAEAVRTFKADRELTRLFFSPDSRYLVGVGAYGTLVWDTESPSESGLIAKLPAATGVGFSVDGKTIALENQGYVTLWKVGEWKPFPQSADPASPIHRVRFSADGKQVVGYTQRGWITWPSTGGPATRLSDDTGVHHEGLAAVSANRRVGVDMLHEPAPGRGTGKFAFRITNFATGKSRRIELDRSAWNTVHINPDGRFIWMQDTGLTAWDASTGEVALHMPQAKNRHLFGAEIAPDGKTVLRSVTGEWNNGGGRDLLGPAYSAVYVTDHVTGREWKMNPIPWSIYSGGATFSRDGSKLIVCGRFDRGWDKDSVTVWDVASGRRLVNWTRDSGLIESVSLSPDGRSLLAGDRSGKLVLIEVATDTVRTSFQHGGRVLSSDFHPDGTKVVASSPEAPVYIWDLIGDAPKWDANKADALWADLAAMDAKKAFAAIRILRANRSEAIAFLKGRVKLPEVPTDAKITALLKQLESPRFTEREQAQKDLILVAELIQPSLQAARKKSSEEGVRRIDAIVKSIAEPTPERLRQMRACEIMEGIGTSEVVKLLNEWAAGPSGSTLTLEAKVAVGRLDRR